MEKMIDNKWPCLFFSENTKNIEYRDQIKKIHRITNSVMFSLS